MAKTATITIYVKYVGDGDDRNVTISHTNTNAPLGFAGSGVQGFNGSYGAASSPGTFLGALYLPPNSQSGIVSTSQVPKRLVQVISDAGIPLDPSAPQVFQETIFGLFLTAPEPIVLKAF